MKITVVQIRFQFQLTAPHCLSTALLLWYREAYTPCFEKKQPLIFLLNSDK